MQTVPILNNTKRILKEQDKTPYRLAQEWNKHSNYVYSLVNQDQWPDGTSLKTLVDLSKLLNVPVEALFTVVE